MHLALHHTSGRPSRWGRDQGQRSSFASPHSPHNRTLTHFYRHSANCWSTLFPKAPRSLRSLILVTLAPCWVILFHAPLLTIAYTRKDLDHYRCNNVYRPWVNRGKRRSKTLQSRVGTSASHTQHRLSPYPLLQLGRTGKTLALRPRADPAPHFGRAAARQIPTFAVFSRL